MGLSTEYSKGLKSAEAKASPAGSLPADNRLCQFPATRLAGELILGLRLLGRLTAAWAFHRTHNSPHRRSTDT